MDAAEHTESTPEVPATKFCPKCSKPKSLDEFGNAKKSKDGKQLWCKQCHSDYAKDRLRNNPEKVRKEARERLKKSRAKNREKFNRKQREWRRANPEKDKATRRKYEQSHKPKLSEKQRNYRRNNPEICRTISNRSKKKKYANDPKAILERNKKWDEAHPENGKIRSAKHRARKKNAPVNDFREQQWQLILILFNFRCAYCPDDCWRCARKKHKLTKDHITPLSKGGSNTMSNIVPACQSCNSKKHTGPPLRPVQPALRLL